MDGEVCTTCGGPTTDGHTHDAPAEGGGSAPAGGGESAPAGDAPAKPWWKFW